RQGANASAATGPRLAARRPGPAPQATGDRQARRPRRGAAGAAPLAEGHRPGRPPGFGVPGETPGGGAEGIRPTVGRRGGVAEEGGGEAEVVTVGRRAAGYSPGWLPRPRLARKRPGNARPSGGVEPGPARAGVSGLEPSRRPPASPGQSSLGSLFW